MKTFCKKIVCLFLPFLLLGVYVEVNLRHVENGYSRKKADLERSLSDIEVLTLGSSHGLFGVDPGQFRQKTFNMAYVSQSLYYDRMLLASYLERLPELQAVIVPISYFSLDTSMSASSEKWRCYFYEKYFSIPVEGAETSGLSGYFDPKRYSMIALYGIPKSFKQLRNNFSLSEVKDQQPNGWLRQDLVVAITDKVGKQRVALHESMMYPGMRADNIAHLQAIADMLRKRHVDLYLVTPPVHPAYTRFVDADRYQSMTAATNNFCVANSCTYLDFFHDKRFNDADFFDSDHLNANGAGKFSQLLDAALVNPANVVD
jgi:hypothetical protein